MRDLRARVEKCSAGSHRTATVTRTVDDRELAGPEGTERDTHTHQVVGTEVRPENGELDMASSTVAAHDIDASPHMQRGMHRLMVAVSLGQSVGDALQMGDAAYVRMVRYLEELQTIDPERLVRLSGDRDGFLRRMVRLIAGCLTKDDNEYDVASRTWLIVGNPNLTVRDVRTILFETAASGPAGEEMSVWEIREIAKLLRAGQTVNQVAEFMGRNRKLVIIVSNFMGYAEYRQDALSDRALAAMVQGVKAPEFARNEGIGKSAAYDYYAKAAAALDDDGDA